MTLAARPGVPSDATFTSRLQQMADEGNRGLLMENHGGPGDTTVEGLARLDAVLAGKPQVVVIEYGHCDCWVYPPATGSRVPLAQFEANLRTMVERVRAAGARPVLLTGNGVIGPENALLDRYYEVTRKLAAELDVPLADVAARWAAVPDREKLMVDSQHVNPAGQDLYVEALEGIILPQE